MTTQTSKAILRRCLYAVVHLLLIVSGVGCAEKNLDRSRVNDPLMSVTSPSTASGVSPLTGLTARSRASGGSACSVCTQ